jgi:hypothetical protein
MLDDIEKESCLARYAWSRREDNLVEGFQLLHLELVIAIDCHFGSQFLDEVAQVVGE